jgi:hypothetical protein
MIEVAFLLLVLTIKLTLRLVEAGVRLALLAGRLALWLLALAGFRGARLLGLAATVTYVRWAVPTVGTGPAVRLAVIGWVAWFTRHHRAAIRRTAAVPRLVRAQHAAAARLTAALERHHGALGELAKLLTPPGKPDQPPPLPWPTTTTTTPAAHGGTPSVPPPLFEPRPALARVTRFVAARLEDRQR